MTTIWATIINSFSHVLGLSSFFSDLTVHLSLHKLKLVWLTGVALGLFTSLFTTVAAWRDADWTRKLMIPNAVIDPDLLRKLEAYRIQAWQSLRKEGVIFSFQLVMLWIRFWAVWWPDPGNPAFLSRWATDGTIVTGLQLILAYECYLDWRDRRRLWTELKAQEQTYENQNQQPN